MSSLPAPSSLPVDPRFSEDDLEHLPNDGKRYQILDGELDVTPSPVPRHQRVSRRLQSLLMRALEDTGLGEVFDAPMDVVLDHFSIVEPDLLFIRAERLDIIGPKNIQGAPDLVVEILSNSTRRTDVITKARLYARFGVPAYWIVDPAIDRIEFHLLEGDVYRLARSATAPEIAVGLGLPEGSPAVNLPLAEIFR